MSYRYRGKDTCLTRTNINTAFSLSAGGLDTYLITQATARSNSAKQQSRRSRVTAAIASATATRVEIEQSILKRHGLLGKRTTDKERARLFAKAPSVFNIAYKRNPDLFKGDLRYA